MIQSEVLQVVPVIDKAWLDNRITSEQARQVMTGLTAHVEQLAHCEEAGCYNECNAICWVVGGTEALTQMKIRVDYAQP